ncbi:unnamed protein product [Phytophthora fragariaefolia]|uniref:Unnamed protein product n=1 Tax=Phytophthora fragariaefolia TaxID=1490495 RepID=A0A9W6U9W1_9STRA|nr:unnamed protein product [Phytophthora fragariaefolia]
MESNRQSLQACSSSILRIQSKHSVPLKRLAKQPEISQDTINELLGNAETLDSSRDSVKARVQCFDKYVSSLIAHVSAAAQEAARAAMRAEALRAAHASITTSAPSGTRSSMTKPIKMSVPTFDGKDSDSLVFWVSIDHILPQTGDTNSLAWPTDGIMLTYPGYLPPPKHGSLRSIALWFLPMDTNMSTGSPNAAAAHVAREDCPHLADPEWEALQRLSTVIGEAAVATMLRTLSPTAQHGVALVFIMKEQHEVAARATVSTPSTPRVESLKLHVNSYVGREGEPLLRWLVEGCVRHVMSWRTSKELGVWTPTH